MTTILGSGKHRYSVVQEGRGYMSGKPFHRCTHTALSPQDEIYVSDGYGNSRVEVSYTIWPQLYPDSPGPKGLRSLQKLQRLTTAA